MTAQYHSQFCEDSLIDGLFRKVGTNNKFAVEIGSADGVQLSNTLFFEDIGWQTVCVEKDRERLEACRNNRPKSICINEEVSIQNSIDSILERTNVPKDLDLLSIDIDGQDYYIWKNMQQYRSRVVVIEYSPYVHGDFLPKPNTDGKNGDNQAGLHVMLELAHKKDYTVVAITPVNIICVALEVSGIGWKFRPKNDWWDLQKKSKEKLMKLSLGKVKQMAETLQTLLNERLPMKEAYSIAKMYKTLSDEVVTIETTRKNLIKQFAVLGDDGEPKSKDGKYVMNDPAGFDKEYRELLMQEVEVSIVKIKADTIEDAKLTPLDLLKLDDIIE